SLVCRAWWSEWCWLSGVLLFFYVDGLPRDLHSFPTRRSSDLRDKPREEEDARQVEGGERDRVPRLQRDDDGLGLGGGGERPADGDRKSTRLNSSHGSISYAVFCLKKKKNTQHNQNNKHTGDIR